MNNKIRKIVYRIFGAILLALAIYLVYLSFLLCYYMTLDVNNREYGNFILHIICLTFSSLYSLFVGLIGAGALFAKVKKEEKG